MARFAAETTNRIHRGDARWCQTAINEFEALHATPIDVDGSPESRPACVGNGHIMRAWLSAPWTPPGHSEPTTNLQANALDWLLVPEQRGEPFWLNTLVDLAQNLGVFGAPGHHISLRLADPPGTPGAEDVEVEVTVSRPGTPPLTSPPFNVTDLVPAGRPPIDTVVGVLHVVTAVTNHLFDLRSFAAANRHQTPIHGNDNRDAGPATWGGRPPAGIRPRTAEDEPVYRLSPGGRPFPPLDTVDPQHRTAQPATTTSTSNRPRRPPIAHLPALWPHRPAVAIATAPLREHERQPAADPTIHMGPTGSCSLRHPPHSQRARRDTRWTTNTTPAGWRTWCCHWDIALPVAAVPNRGRPARRAERSEPNPAPARQPARRMGR